ncbi:MAG: aminopeptidase P family protein [Firmicutes bacterium]|nr:aminopeptidase P family protein [Bacillota bacterium]
MNQITMRIELLRGEMMKNDIDFYIIPSSDYHDSEYVGDYFKEREFMSGFNGSAGTLVISLSEALLWTDGRYFLQAGQQLQGTGIELMKAGEPGVPEIDEYLKDKARFGQTVGYDGRTTTRAFGNLMRDALKDKNVHFRTDVDLVDKIWKDRPEFPASPIFILEEKYAGRSVTDKLESLRAAYQKAGACGIVISSLDDIAWLYNFRGDDVAYTPVAMAFTIVTDQEAIVFISRDAVSPEIKEYYEDLGIRFRPYTSVYGEASRLEGPIMIDPDRASEALIDSVADPLFASNPTCLEKAVKNPTEVENFRKAHIKDGVALTKTLYYVKQMRKADKLKDKTELDIGAYLDDMRSFQNGFHSLSFESIIATGEHGAIIHYEPTPSTNKRIEDGFLLMDTGGHYLQGTTDVTRTLSIGEPTEEMKECYTAVLRGHLDLMAACFPEGTMGSQLDVLARCPLWGLGLDYNHGTGHGVGYLLNVHEGPNSIRKRTARSAEEAPLKPGMITSNEPGVYIEGKFGIRIENLILTKKAGIAGRDGKDYYEFETLTMVPYDRTSIIPERLSDAEIETLNAYHARVYELISPHLTEDEALWLAEETAPVYKTK